MSESRLSQSHEPALPGHAVRDCAARARPQAGFVGRLALAAFLVCGLVAGVGVVFRPGGPATQWATAPALDEVDTDPAVGAQLYANTCAACHGSDGQGMPEQGVPLRGSAFVRHTRAAQLVAFLRTGRPAADPASLSGRTMPPRGGNSRLNDQDLGDVASYIRTLAAMPVAR